MTNLFEYHYRVYMFSLAVYSAQDYTGLMGKSLSMVCLASLLVNFRGQLSLSSHVG